MKNIITFGLFLSVSYAGFAADIRDQLNVQTGKAELFVTGLAPQEVASKTKDALTQWSIPANLNFRALPSPTPAIPDTPTVKEVYIQGAPVAEYNCPTAYAQINKKPPPVKNAFYYNQEFLQACLYQYQGGTKIYLYFTVARKTESLTSGLFNGITKAIRGSDGERIAGQIKENIAEIRKNIPGLLVAKIEAPELQPEEPDRDAVASLFPAGNVQSLQQSPAAPVDVPTPAITAPIATQAASISTPAPAPSTNNSQASQLGNVDLTIAGARKELVAMGFQYFNQDQFVDSVRRNDYLAFRLFLAAAAISPSGSDSKGESALAASQKIVDAKDRMNIQIMLNAFIEGEKSGDYPAKMVKASAVNADNLRTR